MADTRSLSVGLVMLVCAAARGPAQTVALRFKAGKDVVTMARVPQEAKRLGGPPSYLKGPKTKRLVSTKPLYFEARLGPKRTPLAMVLDESKGTGKGYDRLYVDPRGRGDLHRSPHPATVGPGCRGGSVATAPSSPRQGTTDWGLSQLFCHAEAPTELAQWSHDSALPPRLKSARSVDPSFAPPSKARRGRIRRVLSA